MNGVIVDLVVPGWSAWSRNRVVALCSLALGVLVPVFVTAYTVAADRSWVAMSLDTDYLAAVTVAFGCAAAGRLLALGERWVALGCPLRPDVGEWLSVVVSTAVVASLVLGAVQVGRARSAIAPAFGGSTNTPLYADGDLDAGVPSTEPVAPSTAVTTPTPEVPDGPWDDDALFLSQLAASGTTTTTSRPRSGVDPARLADVRTVLLLGGDAGPGRSGLRTDTMMLFSIHGPSGRASLVSLPRDMTGLLFPPDSALGDRYPDGFTELTNAVYPIVGNRDDLRRAYDVDGVHPGVVALAQGIGYSLDVTIDDYVLVDMQGFLELIDAVGGVTVDVPKAVPMPGNVPGAKHAYPDTLGPGPIRMDGTTALGYVRSRKADSDYHRTARQRALLASLASQIAPEDVMLSFNSVVSALGATLRTSLTPDELADMLAVIGGETAIVESVGLVPPLTDVKDPDFHLLARVVGEVRLALATGQPSGW